MRSLYLLLAIAACGTPSAQPAKPKPMPSAFKDMDLDQRTEYMKTVVMPEAKKIFVAFDPKYSTMDCKTCHGNGATDGSFEMPNPQLRVLPASGEAYMALMEKDPDVARYTKFMSGEVEPLIGRLLQRSVFDPKTKSGELSCETCHTLEGKP